MSGPVVSLDERRAERDLGQALAALVTAAVEQAVAGGRQQQQPDGAEQPDGRGLLRVRDAAEWLAVSQTKVREWIDRGLLPVVRCDRMVRIRPEDLTEFRDRHWR